MWLVTSIGFFSLIHDSDSGILVCARVRADIEALLAFFPNAVIECTHGSSDYLWQIRLVRPEATALMAHLLAAVPDRDVLAHLRRTRAEGEKMLAYDRLDADLMALQHADTASHRIHDEPGFRKRMEENIRRNITTIAKQSCLVGVDDAPWDVTRISWTGGEWPGLPARAGICYVEAFEHANPPHDFIFVVSVRTGTPEFVASYEGDMDCFSLTISRLEADSLDLPEQVAR